MLGLSLRKILTLFGAAMMIFVLMNVQFGSVAPRVIDGAEGYKLDAFLMFDPSCSFDKVEEELRTSGSSYCLGEIGQWSGADLLMLMEGLFLFVYGFELPQNKGWARRLRKIGFAMVRRGILPELASHVTVSQVAGFSRAADLLMTGRLISGQEAATMGLIGEAVEQENLLARRSAGGEPGSGHTHPSPKN